MLFRLLSWLLNLRALPSSASPVARSTALCGSKRKKIIWEKIETMGKQLKLQPELPVQWAMCNVFLIICYLIWEAFLSSHFKDLIQPNNECPDSQWTHRVRPKLTPFIFLFPVLQQSLEHRDPGMSKHGEQTWGIGQREFHVPPRINIQMTSASQAGGTG